MKQLHLSITAVALSSLCFMNAPPVVAGNDDPYDIHGFCSGPSDVVAPVEGQMGGTYTVRCMNDAAPGSVFHGVTGTCRGMFHIIGEAYFEAGSCDFVDRDGDTFFGIYEKRGQADGDWRVTGGFGKYAGMTQTGKFNLAMPFPMPAGSTAAKFHWWGNTKLR